MGVTCAPCGRSLADLPPQSKFCSKRCGWWSASHPGEPLPSGRMCEGCGTGIDHTRLNAKTCSSACQRWKFNNPGTMRPVNTECATCQKPLVHKRSDARFCSSACRDASPSNLARYRDKAKARRARIKSGTRPTERVSASAVFDRDRWICGLCAGPIDAEAAWPSPGSPSIDHIVPVSRGGAHTMSNLQAAHLGCNSRKGVGNAVARTGV